MRLAEHYRLRGLASVDALVAGDAVTVLELNPRPGGSLDAYGTALGVDLFALHVAACRGGALPEPDRGRRSCAGIADRLCRSDAHVCRTGSLGPTGRRTVRRRGSVIPPGGPICTVLAQGAATEPLLRLLSSVRADAFAPRCASHAAACGNRPLRYDRQVMTFSQAAPVMSSEAEAAGLGRLAQRGAADAATGGEALPRGRGAAPRRAADQGRRHDRRRRHRGAWAASRPGAGSPRSAWAGSAGVEIGAGSPFPDWPFRVSVSAGDPVVACLASQYAGWSLSHGEGESAYFAMASGPGRARAAKEELFQELAYTRQRGLLGLLRPGDRPRRRRTS